MEKQAGAELIQWLKFNASRHYTEAEAEDLG
jgi:hypothetical protein